MYIKTYIALKNTCILLDNIVLRIADMTLTRSKLPILLNIAINFLWPCLYSWQAHIFQKEIISLKNLNINRTEILHLCKILNYVLCWN